MSRWKDERQNTNILDLYKRTKLLTVKKKVLSSTPTSLCGYNVCGTINEYLCPGCILLVFQQGEIHYPAAALSLVYILNPLHGVR